VYFGVEYWGFEDVDSISESMLVPRFPDNGLFVHRG